MKYVFDYKELLEVPPEPRITTIGNFDGVHLGHRAVMKKARRDADEKGMELAVLTFEPHPAELLKPDGPRLRLVDPQRKVELLAECGADLILAQRFDEDFSKLTAERFARDVLCASLGAKHIIVGENFRFGRGREGDVDLLIRLGGDLGFEVSGEHLVRTGSGDVSSSRIRKSLLEGDVVLAGELLGRYHEVSGTVATGEGEGGKLGFPTINLQDISVVVPGPGIYAAFCDLEHGTEAAAVYLGDRPTFGYGYSVEAHLLDYHENLYGKKVVLRFVKKVRGDQKFDGPEALVAQVSRDIEAVRGILKAAQ